MCGEKALWCDVMQGKYCRNVTHDLDNVIAKSNDLCLWKNLTKLWPKLKDFEYGQSIHAWKQCWVDCGFKIANLDV